MLNKKLAEIGYNTGKTLFDIFSDFFVFLQLIWIIFVMKLKCDLIVNIHCIKVVFTKNSIFKMQTLYYQMKFNVKIYI